MEQANHSKIHQRNSNILMQHYTNTHIQPNIQMYYTPAVEFQLHSQKYATSLMIW